MEAKKTLFLHKEEIFPDGEIIEISFVSAYERVLVRLDLPNRKTILITRPKTETTAFPLVVGKQVTVGVVRFRVLRSAVEPVVN